MPSTIRTSRLMKFFRVTALAFAILIALVTILGKGGGGGANVPVANAISVIVDQDTSVAIDIAAEPGNALGNAPGTVAATDPANGTVTVSGTAITYTPDPGYSGADSFDYTIIDTNGQTATATLSVTVRNTAPPPEVPVANAISVVVDQDTSVAIDIAAEPGNAPGNAPSTVTATDPANGTATVSVTEITYSPDPGYSGADSFDYTISDADGQTATATVNVTVRNTAPPQEVPFANAISVVIDSDTPVAIDVAAEPGNALGNAPSTVTATAPANGMTTVSDTTITYTPDPGYGGADSFDYTITDADGQTATATVSVAVRETVAPTASVHFPAAVALTQVNHVLVTGTATDASVITRVTVAGTDATTTDGYANWRAVVPLMPGDNTLLIETEDEFSNIDPAAATLSVQFSVPLLVGPSEMALDAANGRVLVLSAGGVVAVDLVTGLRTNLSDEAIPDAVNPFKSPISIVLDPTNNRALVIDSGLKAMVAVDLATGARTILSDATTPDTVNPFSGPRGITLDLANGRALVIDFEFDNAMQAATVAAVVAVDLATGARTILSGLTTPDAINSFEQPGSIALDTANGRALVVDGALDAVVAVDLMTGVRTILSDTTTPDAANPFNTPKSIALDPANGRALILDDGSDVFNRFDGVIAMDLMTGARTILSDATTPDAVNPLNAPSGIALDVANGRALVADRTLSTVMAVDLATGARTILSDSATTPGAANPLFSPWNIALDAANGRTLVVDTDRFAVMAVDLATGARTILSDAMTPDSMNPFGSAMFGIAVDAANGRALVPTTEGVFAVDLVTGARTIMSSTFAVSFGAALDATNDQLLLVDLARNGVVAVNLATGAFTILSNAVIPDAVNQFQTPWAIAVDAVNGRALVIDTGLDAVVAVDLMTGARTILSDATTPDAVNPFGTPWSITVGAANDRALVGDISSRSVVAVDLATGARTILSDAATPDAANRLFAPFGLVMDPATGRALVVDTGLGAVVAMELTSGDRVIVSK